jgi:hypothetical protein
LRANLGIIRYNANTNKIQYVSGAELFNQTPAIVNNVIDYNEDKNDNKIMYNSITALPFLSTINNALFFVPWGYLGGFGGGGYEVPAHAQPFHFSVVEIPLDKLLNSALIEDEIPAFVQRLYIAGFNFSTQSGGNVYNNTGIRISRVEVRDKKLILNVVNLSGSVQYLVSIAIHSQFGSYIRPNPILNPSVKNSYTMINQSSINAVGLREYEIDQRFINYEYSSDEFSPVYTQFFDSFGLKDRYISTSLVKVANIACGDVITVNDRNNRKVTGLVTEIDEDEDFTNTVVIREL